MIFFDPWWNSAKDAATCSLWLSAAASCRVQRLGWLVKLYDPTFFLWWTDEHVRNMMARWSISVLHSVQALSSFALVIWIYINNISTFFCPICFLRTTPMHAWPNANSSWVFGGGFERIYFAAILHTRIACMHTQAGTYTNMIITNICIYICINNYI